MKNLGFKLLNIVKFYVYAQCSSFFWCIGSPVGILGQNSTSFWKTFTLRRFYNIFLTVHLHLFICQGSEHWNSYWYVRSSKNVCDWGGQQWTGLIHTNLLTLTQIWSTLRGTPHFSTSDCGSNCNDISSAAAVAAADIADIYIYPDSGEQQQGNLHQFWQSKIKMQLQVDTKTCGNYVLLKDKSDVILDSKTRNCNKSSI